MITKPQLFNHIRGKTVNKQLLTIKAPGQQVKTLVLYHWASVMSAMKMQVFPLRSHHLAHFPKASNFSSRFLFPAILLDTLLCCSIKS